MSLTLTAVALAILCSWIAIRRARVARERHEMEIHSIEPERLHEELASGQEVLVYDVRLPLDVLTNSEIIPGARRVSPSEIIKDPSLIPKDQDSVVYCTCPGDESSLSILHRALARGYIRVRFLRGGLAAWKAKGYPVELYKESFHLDTGAS
jgi:rhodanese-related sulfurtransferase